MFTCEKTCFTVSSAASVNPNLGHHSGVAKFLRTALADSTQTEEHHSEHEKGNIRCQPDAKDALRCSSQESEVVSHHVEVSPCHHGIE
jgi:hypothetical protein